MSEVARSGNLFEKIRHEDHEGEYWTGRELMPLMHYAKWQDFVAVIEKAKASLAIVQSQAAADSTFVQVAQLTQVRNLGQQRRYDYRLTRFGAYLTAMAGDDTKEAIAQARVYFAVKTREAEVAIPRQREPRLETVDDQLRALELATERTQQAIAIARQQIERAELAEAKLGIAKPKADAWDALASAHGDYSVADAAKILCRDHRIQIGRDRLFEMLGSWGWLFRQRADGRWRAMQDQVDCGRFTELPTHRFDTETGEKIKNVPQVRITAKGLKDIRARLIEQPSLFELEPAP